MADRSAVINGFTIRLNRRTGRYDVPVPVAGSKRRRWISTGARTLEKAKEVVAHSGVERLVMLANAGALSADAVSLVTAGRRVTCREVLEGWQQETAGRWSPSTAAIYRINLAAFLDHGNAWDKPITAVTYQAIQMFVNGGESKQATRALRLTCMRSLYRYAKAHNYVLENLAETVFVKVREMTFTQLERRQVFPLTDAEYRMVVEDPRTSPFWRTVTAIAYWTGMRFGDCAGLEWASVRDAELIVWTKKRGRRVALPLDDPLIGAGELRRALAAVPRTDPVYCFPEHRQEIRTSKHSQAFKRILERLGIHHKSFHSTRHAAITRLALAGKTLEQIGRLVAHSNPETTRKYIHV